MNKTLTALVMTGALAVGACGPRISRDTDSVTYTDTLSYQAKTYKVEVTDRKPPILDDERQVRLYATDQLYDRLDATGGEAPLYVFGATGEPLSAVPFRFSQGAIRYRAEGEAAPIGCTWGFLTESPYFRHCTSNEIAMGTRMLNAGAQRALRGGESQ
jgi:hypothetical protein